VTSWYSWDAVGARYASILPMSMQAWRRYRAQWMQRSNSALF